MIEPGDRVRFYADTWCDGTWIAGRVESVFRTSQGQAAEVVTRRGTEHIVSTEQLEKIG